MSASLIVVTTVVRRAGPDEASSYLRVVDLDSGSVVGKAAVPESPHRAGDPNPRGGLRGARGAGCANDRLVVAASDRLYVLGSSWRLEREITHPWMGGVHGIMVEPEAIWVTSTAADLLLRFDWDGALRDAWCWREDAALVAALGFDRVPAFDESRDYRVPAAGAAAEDLVHLNGLSRSEDGLLLSFGQVLTPRGMRNEIARSSVARVAARVPVVRTALALARRRREAGRRETPSPAPIKQGGYAVVRLADEAPRTTLRGEAAGTVVFRKQPTHVPNHDVVERGGRLLFCDSNESRLSEHDPASGRRLRSVAIPGSPPFARGLLPLADGRFVVGSQEPTAVHVVDLAREEVDRSIDLDGLEAETVFAIAALPPSFAAPPAGGDLGEVFLASGGRGDALDAF